jgi:hypothetical protein
MGNQSDAENGADSPAWSAGDDPGREIANRIASQVASGWPNPVTIQRTSIGTLPAAILIWQEPSGAAIAAITVGPGTGMGVAVGRQSRNQPVQLSKMMEWPTPPPDADLVLALRTAMEAVSDAGLAKITP